MKDSTARELRQIPGGYLLEGLDPRKRRHAAAITTPQTAVVTKLKVDNSLEGFVSQCQQVDHSFNEAVGSAGMPQSGS